MKVSPTEVATDSNVQKLSHEFSKVLKQWLGEKKMAKLIKKNEKIKADNSHCASHDYCDANMAMFEAFTTVVGREYVFYNDEEPETEKQNEYDNALWDKAWTMAKKNDFYPDEKFENGGLSSLKPKKGYSSLLDDINSGDKSVVRKISAIGKFAKGGVFKKRYSVYLSTEKSGENTWMPDYETDDYQSALDWAKKKSKDSDPGKPEGYEYSDYDYAASVYDSVSQKIIADYYNGESNYVEEPEEKPKDKKYYASASASGSLPFFGERKVGSYYSEKTKATNDPMAVVKAYNRNADYKEVEKLLSDLVSASTEEDEFPHPLVMPTEAERASDYKSAMPIFNKWKEGKDAATAQAGQMAMKLFFGRPVKDVQIKGVHYKKGGAIKNNSMKKFEGGGYTGGDAPGVYIADLAAYNNGNLVGEWLNISDYSSGSEVMDAINEIVDRFKEADPDHEEWAAHDWENVPESMTSESPSEDDFDKIIELYSTAEKMNVPVGVISEWVNDTGGEVGSAEGAYQGEYDDEEDFAYRMVEDGVITDLTSYLSMTDTDRRIVAGEEADARADNEVHEDELISDAGMNDELDKLSEKRDRKEDLEAEIEEAREELEEAEGELSGLEEELYAITDESERDEAERLKGEIIHKQDEVEEKKKGLAALEEEFEELSDFDFDEKKTELSEAAQEKLKEDYYDEIYKSLGDPVRYFVNENRMYSAEDLAKQSFIMVDYKELADDLKSDYTFVRHEGKTYVFSDNYARGGTIKAKKKEGIGEGDSVTIKSERIVALKESNPRKGSAKYKTLKEYEGVANIVGEVYKIAGSVVGVNFGGKKLSLHKDWLQELSKDS